MVINIFCRYCGKAFSNVWKHQSFCNKKPEVQPVPQEAETIQPGLFLAKLKVHISSQVAPGTARQWNNKAEAILNHWQTTIVGFDPDKLFEALHHDVT